MSRRRAAWTNHLGTKGGSKSPAEISRRFRQASEEHDMLELACVNLARVKYRVELYKADAQAVKVFNKHTNKHEFITRCKSGIPDRIAVISPTGRLAGFEFKTGDARPRPNQEKIHNELIASGAAVYTIRGVDEFDCFLQILVGIERDKKRWQELGQKAEQYDVA